MRFQAIYRQKWSSQFATGGEHGDAAYQVVSAEWAEALGDLKHNEIATGLERMKRSQQFEEWRPNPMQFKRLCRPRREVYQRSEFALQAPPAPPAPRESALKHLKEIRKRLGSRASSHANTGEPQPDHGSL